MSSGGSAFWVAILDTPVLIRWLARNHIGQTIREEGPATQIAKAGTPTMGGITIVGSVLAGYVIGHLGTTVRFSATGWLLMVTVFSFGAIGFLDDCIKVRHRR